MVITSFQFTFLHLGIFSLHSFQFTSLHKVYLVVTPPLDVVELILLEHQMAYYLTYFYLVHQHVKHKNICIYFLTFNYFNKYQSINDSTYNNLLMFLLCQVFIIGLIFRTYWTLRFLRMRTPDSLTNFIQYVSLQV